jgi:hypothetical protein
LHGTAWHHTAGDRLIEVLPQLNEEQCPWEKTLERAKNVLRRCREWRRSGTGMTTDGRHPGD